MVPVSRALPVFRCSLRLQGLPSQLSVPVSSVAVFSSRVFRRSLQFQGLPSQSSVPGFSVAVFSSRAFRRSLQFRGLPSLFSVPGFFPVAVDGQRSHSRSVGSEVCLGRRLRSGVSEPQLAVEVPGRSAQVAVSESSDPAVWSH